MNALTPNLIANEYDNALIDCSNKCALDQWVHQPVGMDFTQHKTKYGMVTRDGQVLINRAFIGTQSIVQLRNTLRHELAHLAVGLDQHHNRLFKYYERLFCAREPVDESEWVEFRNNIPFKWQLRAHLMDGRMRDIGFAHRRSRAYLNYPNNQRVYFIEKTKIKYFEYIQLH